MNNKECRNERQAHQHMADEAAERERFAAWAKRNEPKPAPVLPQWVVEAVDSQLGSLQ